MLRGGRIKFTQQKKEAKGNNYRSDPNPGGKAID